MRGYARDIGLKILPTVTVGTTWRGGKTERGQSKQTNGYQAANFSHKESLPWLNFLLSLTDKIAWETQPGGKILEIHGDNRVTHLSHRRRIEPAIESRRTARDNLNSVIPASSVRCRHAPWQIPESDRHLHPVLLLSRPTIFRDALLRSACRARAR